ncbi:SH3 domain-binding protein 1 [Alexandromys fortis]|uniref:SH3 domain-binding protein 1 n=1 Tax=Alexandromys fortis TaxID=100897 RepID=UPI0021527CAD|nr:SH3 domain-binding protein 1-like [Microtus fortis]
MAAKEPVPARSSTSRTRPPLPPPRAASLCATPSLRGSRARGHAPDTPPPGHTTPPSPRASEAASPGKARARECGRTRRAFGALGTSLLQGSRGARRPHPRSHRATAAAPCPAPEPS